MHDRIPRIDNPPRPTSSGSEALLLLDLGFAELDVLLGDRIVFLLYHFLGLGARILLRDVEIAGIGARHELDLDHGRLGHRGSPRLSWGRADHIFRSADPMLSSPGLTGRPSNH